MPFEQEKFERPPEINPKQEGKEKKEKEEEKFREFLAQQISRPEGEWSEEFRNYIKKKDREKTDCEKTAEILERSIEEEQQLTFERYLKGLDLREEDLRRKRILDLGCGKGEFVKECLERKLTSKAYGLDLKVEPSDHFIQGNFEDKASFSKIPQEEFDYIVSFGAIEAPASEEEEGVFNPRATLKNALGVLKENGEIRIYPIRRAPPESGLKGIEFARKKWMETLETLFKEENIKYELKPIDIGVDGKKPMFG